MEKYKHIEKFEKIRVEQEELLNNFIDCLTKLENTHEEYKSLIEYYYSAQRNQDLEDDANHLIPQDLKRGVLSEDEIYNLMGGFSPNKCSLIGICIKHPKTLKN